MQSGTPDVIKKTTTSKGKASSPSQVKRSREVKVDIPLNDLNKQGSGNGGKKVTVLRKYFVVIIILHLYF